MDVPPETPLISGTSHRTRPPAPFLPMSRAEMDILGWDACDIVLVTGDAYVDHPSFGMAIIGRLLEDDALSLRDWPTVAITAMARDKGVMLHRVHEVQPNWEALRMIEAISSSRASA